MCVDLIKLQKGRANMDMENRPSFPGEMSGDDYMILEGLLFGNGQCARGDNGCGTAQNSCPCQEGSQNSRCPSPHFPDNVHLAMVYSPDQEFEELYCPEDGLEAGTVFMKLDKPFGGRTISGGKRR